VAEVHHFEFGLISPTLAGLSAIFGCLLGVILTTKAQKVSGGRRARLLGYAAVAIGITAVWQSNVLALMGLAVPGSMLRLDPAGVALSLGLAVIPVGAGLFLIGSGKVGFPRLLTAGGLIGIGVAGTHILIVGSVRIGGVVTYDRPLRIVSVMMAMVAACALLRFVVALRGLGAAVSAAVVSGLAICGVHYVGQYALRVHLGPVPGLPPEPVTGLAPMTLMLPTMVFGGVLIALLGFFTVGTATRRDLRAIFSATDHSGQIEPWIIDAVVRRVATPAPGPDEAAIANHNAVRRSRLTGLAPVFRSVQVARTLDPHAIPGRSAPVVAMNPVSPAPAPPPPVQWSDRVPAPAGRAPEPARARDRNTRQPIDTGAEDRNATLRRVSTVHRDPPPMSGIVPVSPAPGLPVRPRPATATLAATPDTDTRPRNRRGDD
jgi:NO-binding membrane sensor protein with MHYT domain